MEIKAVKRVFGANVPGLASALLIPADKIVSMPDWWWNGEISEDPVIEESSTSWLFWLSDLGGEIETRERLGSSGTRFETEISFPYVSPASERAVFDQLRGRPCVILATTLQGNRILAGSKDRPLLPDIRRSTGNLSGLYGYRCSFSGISLLPPAAFTGTLAAGNFPPAVEFQMNDFHPADFSNFDFY